MQRTTSPVRKSSTETIRLHHCSPRRNLKSLLRTGIQHTLSRCAREEVWLTAKRLTAWASEHVQVRHSTDRTISIEVEIPEAQITRRRDGIYTLPRTVRPDEFISINGLRIYRP